MAKKYYSTKVVGIGGEAEKFSRLAKMIVIFDDSMVLPELREFSVLHSGNKLTDVIFSRSATKSITISKILVISLSSSTTTRMTCLKAQFTSRINPFRKFVSATRLKLSKKIRWLSAAKRRWLSARIKRYAQRSR